jgi:prepilin-type N-terminal cleavage/methylation domain-containing protein
VTAHISAHRRNGIPARTAGFSLIELLITMVVMLLVLGVVSQVVVRSNVVYAQQRNLLERRYSTATGIEMMLRLLRQAKVVNVDPDGNGTLDSIRIQADWNPRNGTTFPPDAPGAPVDPWEDVTFTVANNTLFKREPADAAPIAFADNINSLTFEYFNGAGGQVPNAFIATQAQLAFVHVTVGSPPVDGLPGVLITSSASIRRLE